MGRREGTKKLNMRLAMIDVQYSTPVSLSSQIFHCSLPLRLDAYKGCSFYCSYCFARNRGGDSRSKDILPARSGAVARLLDRALSNREDISAVVEFLRAKVPIHFGGMSDPFQTIEARQGISKQYLKDLKSYSYPTVLSTRSTLVATDEYVAILKNMPVVVQFSLSTISDKQAERVEPFAPRPSEVLQAIKTLSREGVVTSCRWQPYIPDFSPPAMEFVDALHSAGVKQISLEHLKIPLERDWHPALSKGASVIRKAREKYLASGASRDGREYILPAAEKKEVVFKVRAECHKRGIAFGAADNEFQYLSDGEACCSSVDVIGGFSSIYRYTVSNIVKRQAASGGDIRFLDDNQWRPSKSIDRYLNSHSRLVNCDGESVRTIEQYIRKKWNELKGPSSPMNFYGVIFTGRSDASGMNIYKIPMCIKL